MTTSTLELKEDQVLIGDLHFEHALWINQLNFYEEEITIFNKRLEDVVRKSMHKDALKNLEHFQNQYIVQMDVIHGLKHKVRTHGRNMNRNDRNLPLESDNKYLGDHAYLQSEMQGIVTIYDGLKREFMHFLASYS